MAKKILIVDYEEIGLAELTGFFREREYSLLFARDGAQAVEFYRTEKPDLVLTSALLPKINGFDLSKMISNGHLGAAKPVIIYSNIYKAVKYRREAIEVSGAAEFLEKPLDRDHLLQLTDKLIASSGLADASHPHPGKSVQTGSGVLESGDFNRGTAIFPIDTKTTETNAMQPTDILDMEFLDGEKKPIQGQVPPPQDEILELVQDETEIRQEPLEKTEEVTLPDQESLSAVDEILGLALEESKLRADSSFGTQEPSSILEIPLELEKDAQLEENLTPTLEEETVAAAEEGPVAVVEEEAVTVVEEEAVAATEEIRPAWNPVTLSATPQKKSGPVRVIAGWILLVLTLLTLIYYLIQKNPI
jgi:CheY-like chemotaxis protein